MAKVKVCPRIALPAPSVTLPPPPPLIPTSVVTLKSVPSASPPVPVSTLIKKDVPPPTASSSPLPTKKACCPPPPFIKGQVGRKLFSLQQPRFFCSFPNGCSLIISAFRKPLPHENCKTKFVIIDPYGGTWCAPRVFEVWCDEVESGAITKDDFITHQIAIVRDGSEFFISFSDRKTRVNLITYEIQKQIPLEEEEEAFPQADSEDKHEKRDPDFHPDELD